MNNKIGETLKDLIKKHGISLCGDPKRCRALLLDCCGEYKTEINVLIKALEEEIPSVLLSSRITPYDILKGILAKKLCDEIALTEQAASWSVGTWAFALEVKSDLPDSTTMEENSAQHLEKADAFLQTGDYEEAILYCDQALKLDPKSVDALIFKGISLTYLSRSEEAMLCCDRALVIDPKSAGAWYFKGKSLHKLGRYKEALTCSDRVIEIDPKYAEAWNNKGVILACLRRYKEALTCFDQALMLDPKSAIIWVNKGCRLAELKRYKEALTCFDRVIEIDPKNAEAWYYRGACLEHLNRKAEAIFCYDRLKELDTR